ncbi:CHAD domain-containing protein [Gordonia oryzae]|uniref:CHAD domain-containing protein n=1 Tax=Gordonia oryzae TaxID=2487349 RepID=A0A3N4GWD7_9ACTN|nr:CYTH and CHAD domain-containing protein [Gordonia oryzae]RPA63401.1 CHAD domain-containing protein [Gordonia oryzae]
MATEQVEVELKFDVEAGTATPDLRVLPGVVGAREPETFTLDATYFDTDNLDLAGNRITLRRRTGGHDSGWHLKRPSGIPGARRELQIAFDEAPADGDLPDALLIPVLALTRHRSLIPVAVISTSRTITTLFGVDEEPLAEFAEDLVTARSLLPGGEVAQWAEWEFELLSGGTPRLLKAAHKLLRSAGGSEPSSASKLARAIGSTPTTTVEPRLPKRPSALELVVTDLTLHRNALLTYDPEVRVDAPDAVHQMRVATRRFRSVLSGFPTVLDPHRTAHINDELRLLARILGDARDSEVQLEIDTALLRGESPSEALVSALTGTESDSHDRAIRAAHAAMNSERYFRLLDDIDVLITDPPAGPDADMPAAAAVDAAIAKSRKKIRKAQEELATFPEGSHEWQEQVHVIRKRAKKLRYATDAGEPLGIKRYQKTAAVAKKIQSALGDFNDTRINRARLAELAERTDLPGRDMFLLGRLDALQEAAGARALDAYRKAAKDL